MTVNMNIVIWTGAGGNQDIFVDLGISAEALALGHSSILDTDMPEKPAIEKEDSFPQL